MNEDEFWEAVQNNKAPDPVRQYELGWYFYDETWADMYGPFPTESEARESLDRYAKLYLGA